MSYTPTVPAGWYPDPEQPGGVRWWDGTRWTEQRNMPYSATPVQSQANADTNTVFIWLLVAIPLLQSIAFAFFDWESYMRASLEPTQSITAILTPEYLLLLGASWGGYLLTALLAFLDWRALKERIDRPFHFAWVFLYSPVYMIGRPIVARSRAGGSLAVIWAYIASFVLSMIVITISLFSQMSSFLSAYGY